MRGHPLLAQLPQPRSTFADGGAVSGKNLLQGQGQRAADVVVLVGEQELRIFRIERDEAADCAADSPGEGVLGAGPTRYRSSRRRLG